VEEVMKEGDLEILGVLESFVKEGAPGPEETGYYWVGRGRIGNLEKGGLGFLLKEGVEVEVLGEGTEEGEDKNVHGESMWVGINTKGGRLAMGLVYLRPGWTTNVQRWNRAIMDKVSGEIALLRARGYKIMLGGDLNTTLVAQEGGVVLAEDGRRGEVAGWVGGLGLEVGNWLPVTVGKWTRMQGDKKSVLDYWLLEGVVAKRVNRIFIDDQGMYDIPSDHNVMLVEIRMEGWEGTRRARFGWKMGKKTDWALFGERVDAALEEWEGGLRKGSKG
jgi:hypothetical protein